MENPHRLLVLDRSPVVRAALAKHLKDSFEVRVEVSGELAWHAVVLDSSIIAVIAGTPATGLENQEFLQRLRSSSLRRLNQLPYLLIASDTRLRELQRMGNSNGISGYISKTMLNAGVVEQVRAVLDPVGRESAGKFRDQAGDEGRAEASLAAPRAFRDEATTGRAPALLLRHFLARNAICLRLAQALSSADRKASPISVLMFGIVDSGRLIAQFGEAIADEIEARLGSLLLSKIGPYDCMGRAPGKRLIIAARGVDSAQCAHFARRVFLSLAQGRVTVRGQPVKLVVAAGVAASSESAVFAAEDMLTLAAQRLDRALVCGGSTLVADCDADFLPAPGRPAFAAERRRSLCGQC